MHQPNFLWVIALVVSMKMEEALGFSVRMSTEGKTVVHTKSKESKIPQIIQGGMGIRISSWKLAREVARQDNCLGMISGTAMDTILVRTLQCGDPHGDMRRALAAFPDQAMVARFMDKYYIKGGKEADKPYRSLPMWTVSPSQALLEATVLANFCEVWLAKNNDHNTLIEGALIGINRLTKVQLPTLASLYGAMLADVDYVLMGAGIPLRIPGVLDAFSQGKEATFPIEVTGSDETMSIRFDPAEFWNHAGRPELNVPLKRPKFVPIVSSVVLAQSMLKRADGAGPTRGIDGFVVELPTAGGHNAPPRGFRYDAATKSHAVDLNERGEPVYGPKDEVDLEKFGQASQGLPFWMAGSFAHPDRFCDVLAVGAAGIQAGTIFALAQESGMDPQAKQDVLKRIAANDLSVLTDPAASPTGFPFKVVEMDGTLANEEVYQARPRICSLGYLRSPYIDSTTGKLGYKCAAEPVEDWVAKGGEVEATKGRKCLCNALCADAGFPQTRTFLNKEGERQLYTEDRLVTLGDDVDCVKELMTQNEEGVWSYSAADAIAFLKSQWAESSARHELKEEIQDQVRRERSEMETISPVNT